MAELLEAVERHCWDGSRLSLILPGSEAREEPGRFLQVLTTVPIGFMNPIVSGRLTLDGAGQVIAGATAALRDRGLPGLWWLPPSAGPEDMGDRLEANGWSLQESMPWMARPLDDPLAEPGAVAGLVVRRVRSPADQAAWLEVMRSGFGLPDPIARGLDRLSSAAGTDGVWLRYVAFLDGMPAGSAGLNRAGAVPGLYNVATVPGARRRGVATAVTLAALRDARAGGATMAVLGTTEMGRGIYERLGFRPVGTIDIHGWPAEAPT
jgi:ribosomal protein S18 acetylase RimI-like enzyme